jgi:hypothetical protein
MHNNTLLSCVILEDGLALLDSPLRSLNAGAR